MGNLHIGISGLQAAQKAIDTIGNNIANAATPGYHRQRLNLNPAYSAISGVNVLGGGVESGSITRKIDNLLEKEILRQNSSYSQINQELSTLQIVESAFGELSGGGGLNEALDNFFNALSDLSNNTSEIIWQQQTVTSAQTMASQFRTLGDFLSDLDRQIVLEAENLIEHANALINKIAILNDDIEKLELRGTGADNLQDERDQLITELSDIIGVDTLERDSGVVDVTAGGIAVVIATIPTEIEVGTTSDGSLGISIKGDLNYSTSISGGKLGGIINLKNSLLGDVSDDLDTMALQLVRNMNEYHVQGIGSYGSFSRLDGWTMTTEVLSEMDPPITSGEIFIRVTDTSTGVVSRGSIDLSTITPADAGIGLTISDVAAELDSITGINSWYNTDGLHIERSASNYEFDFLPAVLPSATASSISSGNPPSIELSGSYTGSSNDTLTFTATGNGSVGNGTLNLAVTDGSGQLVTTLSVGDGYAIGEELDLGNGVKVKLGEGDFLAGDEFECDVFADTDMPGLLAATGMNCFFSGTGASDIGVCSDLVSDPMRVATSLEAGGVDNFNVEKFMSIADESISELGNTTIQTFYQKLVTDIGQEMSLRDVQKQNLEGIIQNLSNQRDEVSGVDINEEAAQLLVFEQMFNSMAKFLATIRETMDYLLTIA